MSRNDPKITTDAIKILDHLFFEGKPERLAELEEAREADKIARQIYELRNRAGLTQRELAKRVNTTASVISRLEDADYEGHSLTMLRRIAAALESRVEVSFVPLSKATSDFGSARDNEKTPKMLE
jgi:ribosome-binding protein aMBF1 (putative translation factor)